MPALDRTGGPRPFPPPPQTRAAIREWDRRAIEEFGVPGIVLMENAGAGAARIIEEALAPARGSPGEPVRIICGPGNNGGDGFVVARHLYNRGLLVEVTTVGDGGYPPGSDAGVNFEIVRRLRVPLIAAGGAFPEDGSADLSSGVIVDALFGTGLSRPLRPPFIDWVEAISASGRPVISLDIPSGLDADTGEPLGSAVVAERTITFAASKVGFERGSGPRHAGVVHVIDVGIPREIWEGGP